MTRFIALPLLTVAVLYALVSPTPVVALGLAVLTVIPLVIRARFEASKAAQVVIGITLFGGAITVLVTLLAENYASPEVLRTPWAAFAGASLLVAVTRNYFDKPIGGDSGTIGVALCALTGCGGAKTDLIYPLFVLLFIATAALARRRADAGSAPRAALGAWPSLLRGGALLAITGAIASVFIVSLPPLHEWAVMRILQRMQARSGFSQRMWLGSMRGMLMSDRKVLRVHGEGVDYLRGIVYSRYLGGRWEITDADQSFPERPREALPETSDVVEIRYVDAEPKRYFLPLESGELAVSSGRALVNRHGVISPVAAYPAYRAQYRRTGERTFSVAPPDPGDLDVPPVLRALTSVAQEWAKDAKSPREAADAISARLQRDYDYSLDHEYDSKYDPIVSFVYDNSGGHCEFFASAMAMMLRTLGIPTRLVGGYRVTEYNAIGEYYIVRERNAHAWVEVYLPEDGWTTYDPTPASEVAQHASTATSPLAGFIDTLSSGWASFLSWLDERTWAEVLSVPAVLIVIPLLIRIVLRRRARMRESKEDAYGRSLACFVELEEALAQRGVVRGATETIEQLARRLDDDGAAPLARDGPQLLRRYAALRYGGIGDESALSSDIRAFCRGLQVK